MARLLVAEDEDGTRLSLTHVLRREGYEVDEATDGLEAERLGTRGEHALVILDVEMPGLDGIEVCRRIRAARPAVPIMMLTGRSEEADAVTGFDAGADDYVAKPFRLAGAAGARAGERQALDARRARRRGRARRQARPARLAW